VDLEPSRRAPWQAPRPPLISTGDPRVDAAVGPLASIEETDLAARPAVLREVHDRLREILGELGEAGQPAASR
jgi:hypothetical protein